MVVLEGNIDNVSAMVKVDNDDEIEITNEQFHGKTGKRVTTDERELKVRK